MNEFALQKKCTLLYSEKVYFTYASLQSIHKQESMLYSTLYAVSSFISHLKLVSDTLAIALSGQNILAMQFELTLKNKQACKQ